MSIVDDVAAARPNLFLASRMKRLAERLQAQTMNLIKAADLPVQPSNVLLLAVLYERGPQTIGGLASALSLAQPTVTRAVAGLVDIGIVAMEKGQPDKRRRSVALTETGRAMWERADRKIWAPLEGTVDDMLSGMGNDLLGSLRELESLLAVRPMQERVRDRTGYVPRPSTTALPEKRDHGDDRSRAVFRWASTKADFEACIVMLERHIEALRRPEAASYLEVTATSLRQTYSSDRARVLVAELDGDPVGMLAFKALDERRAVLNYFYVEPAARGHGVGRSLMATVLDEVRAAEYREAVLSTLPVLATAQAVYASFGFERTAPLYPDLPGTEYYRLDLTRDAV